MNPADELKKLALEIERAIKKTAYFFDYDQLKSKKDFHDAMEERLEENYSDIPGIEPKIKEVLSAVMNLDDAMFPLGGGDPDVSDISLGLSTYPWEVGGRGGDYYLELWQAEGILDELISQIRQLPNIEPG